MEQKKKIQFWGLPPCPECGCSAKYRQFLLKWPGQRLSCSHCGKRTKLVFSGRSVLFSVVIFMAVILFNCFVLDHTTSILPVFFYTFLFVVFYFALLPFTLKRKTEKKPAEK